MRCVHNKGACAWRLISFDINRDGWAHRFGVFGQANGIVKTPKHALPVWADVACRPPGISNLQQLPPSFIILQLAESADMSKSLQQLYLGRPKPRITNPPITHGV